MCPPTLIVLTLVMLTCVTFGSPFDSGLRGDSFDGGTGGQSSSIAPPPIPPVADSVDNPGSSLNVDSDLTTPSADDAMTTGPDNDVTAGNTLTTPSNKSNRSTLKPMTVGLYFLALAAGGLI